MSIPEDFISREINRAISEAERPSGMSTHDGKARVDAAILRRLLAERDALRALMNDAMHDPEWRDKTIYPCRGEPYQNWLLQIYLPVPSDSTDKSPERALERAIAARRHQRRARGGR